MLEKSMTMAAPAGVAWQQQDVDVTQIEQHISDLWKEMTRNSALEFPVRTSIFNLVVHASKLVEAKHIAHRLARLPGRIPSRAIILVGDRRSASPTIDAEAEVFCTSRSLDRQPLCHEQVIVTGHGRAADHLASVAIPLLVPELPTYLWWPGQPPFGQRSLHRLLAICDQFIVDSAEFASPGDGFAQLVHLNQGRQWVNDFNWGRLKPWREVIAQFFDGPTWRPYATGVLSARLSFGAGGNTHLATAGTLLLLGWVSSCLGWEPDATLDELICDDARLAVRQRERLVEIDLHFSDRGRAAAGRLMSLELVSQPRGLPPARFSVDRDEDLDHASVRMCVHGGIDSTRIVPLDVKTDLDLLADELEWVGRDGMYENAARLAGRLAGREVWESV